MYVASAAVTLDIDASTLEAAGGGSGAAPASSVAPGSGSSGVQDDVSCVTTCNYGICLNIYGSGTSAAGGVGGPGGPAGTSGSGAEGPSHALVVVGSDSVTVTNTSMVALDAPRLDAPTCGDGAPDPGEQCDDGNRIDGDACSNACTINCGGTDTLNPIDGTCIRVHSSPLTWDMARAACQHVGTGWDLMVFDSAEVLASTFSATSAPAASYWVGYRLPGAGMSWAGVDGSTLPLGSPPWAPGEPALDAPCVEVAPSTQLLNDVVCGSARPSICGRLVQNYQCQTGDGGDCG